MFEEKREEQRSCSMEPENREDQVPAAPAAEAAEPEEVVSWYVLKSKEPEEVVSWYIPKRTEPAEVVDMYVQRTPMPGNIWKEAAKKEKKRRRLGLWIFLGCLAVLIAVVVGVGISSGLFSRNDAPDVWDDPSGDGASSIVDIFTEKKTTIPRYQGDPNVRLVCRSEHGEELTAQQVYEKVNPSVVTVVSVEGDSGSVGTGIIMTEDGYILTNAHVISGGQSCWVALDTGVTYDAELVGFDETEDLAVLKAINAQKLTAAEFGDSELAVVGDTVYAIGNPLGVELRGTLTNGIISAINRAVEMGGTTMTLIQTNAALNNGNSGGPLINAYGQVIGINTLKMSNTDLSSGGATVEGLGFALPISSVSFVANDLIAVGKFRGMPTIGITVMTVQKTDGGTQVEVYEVDENFGAAEAGVLPGDVILAADGHPISINADLLEVRRSHSIGDTVVLTIRRGEEQFDVNVVMYSNKK